jgi:hypothetical protein
MAARSRRRCRGDHAGRGRSAACRAAFRAGRDRGAAGTAGRRAAAAFFHRTRKAYLKAVGQGLSIPLDSVDTTSDIIAPSDSETAHKSSRWSLHSFEVGHDCAAAVSIQGAAAHIRGFDWR